MFNRFGIAKVGKLDEDAREKIQEKRIKTNKEWLVTGIKRVRGNIIFKLFSVKTTSMIVY